MVLSRLASSKIVKYAKIVTGAYQSLQCSIYLTVAVCQVSFRCTVHAISAVTASTKLLLDKVLCGRGFNIEPFQGCLFLKMVLFVKTDLLLMEREYILKIKITSIYEPIYLPSILLHTLFIISFNPQKCPMRQTIIYIHFIDETLKLRALKQFAQDQKAGELQTSV